MKRIVLWLATLLALLAGCSALQPTPTSPGQEERERIVANLLDAFERRDPGAIAALTDPKLDATADIEALMQQYGGVRLEDVRVTWDDPYEGNEVTATISGAAEDGSPVLVRVRIVREGDDLYYLGIGWAAPSGPVADPNSPVP